MLEIDWIVCRGQERQVTAGCLRCPAQQLGEADHEIRVEDCLECRHLIATPMDREPKGMCATEMGDRNAIDDLR